jgi:hypothetical protein
MRITSARSFMARHDLLFSPQLIGRWRDQLRGEFLEAARAVDFESNEGMPGTLTRASSGKEERYATLGVDLQSQSTLDFDDSA